MPLIRDMYRPPKCDACGETPRKCLCGSWVCPNDCADHDCPFLNDPDPIDWG
jgi:hypothetical protein